MCIFRLDVRGGIVKQLKKAVMSGFTLVELLVSMTLGLIITGALVQVYQSNNQLMSYNYALSNIQQDGRYLISALRQSLMPVGMYNEFSANLDRNVDVDMEAIYIRSHPVVIVADYDVDPAIGSIEGADAGPDTLVVNIMSSRSCTGSNFDFANGSEFHVLNEYYIEDNTLRCRGHDGRYLRGLKANGANGQSVTILENVYDFQVLYGLSQPTGAVETGMVTSWINASRLIDFVEATGQIPIVALKIAVLVKNDEELALGQTKSLKMLGHTKFTPDDDGLYRVFETAILMRNAWNNVVSGG